MLIVIETMEEDRLDRLDVTLDRLSRSIDRLTEGILTNLKVRVEHFENWLQNESRINEMEVTQGAQVFMEGLGYTVTPLQVRKIFDEGGQTLVEWDGVFVAEKGHQNVLGVVESKHQVQQEHVNNRLEYVERFRRFLSELRRHDGTRTHRAAYDSVCGALRPFASYDVVLFLGGPHFNENIREYASDHGVYCVTLNGSRYDVLGPRKNNSM